MGGKGFAGGWAGAEGLSRNGEETGKWGWRGIDLRPARRRRFVLNSICGLRGLDGRRLVRASKAGFQDHLARILFSGILPAPKTDEKNYK
jgi:hypothetical protein